MKIPKEIRERGNRKEIKDNKIKKTENKFFVHSHNGK